MDNLTLLGVPSLGPIEADQLEVITAPLTVDTVQYTTIELTTLCPVTGQPDYYHAAITYVPQGKSIESKSLKLYLQSHRDRGTFCENLAATIAEDVSRKVDVAVTVDLIQQTRGGLTLRVSATSGGNKL